MSKSKPALVRLSELTPGQSGDFFALLSERVRGARRDGKPFFTCRFRDRDRTATFMVWSDGPWFEECEHHWREGRFYKIRGGYDEHATFGPQIEVVNLREVIEADHKDGFSAAEFVDASRFEPEEMFKELLSIAETHIAGLPLRRLVLTLLARYSREWKQSPATRRHFYPFAGGLLEHTLSVTRTCMYLADKYASLYPDLTPPIDRDLVVAGAILHDLGRVKELTDDVVRPEPTVQGRMLGHLMLGRDLIRDTARELGDVDSELLGRLEHIAVAHLGLPEWGSPRLPLIPECLIVHHADDLDAKVEMFARCLTNDTEDGPFTARDPILGRNLYKGPWGKEKES